MTGLAPARLHPMADPASPLPPGDPSDLVFLELDPECDCKSYLVASRATGEAVVIDPLLDLVAHTRAVLAQQGLRLLLAIDTHTHADHLSGGRELVASCGGRTAGSPRGSVHLPLAEGDVLEVGRQSIRVWATPGHTADSISLLFCDRVFAGDTLMLGSTGRTDLPSGDAAQEWDSVERLLTLPDRTLLLPGHDYAGRRSGTVGEERRENGRVLLGRERFLAAMNAPRPSKPALLEQALVYNRRPLET